MPTQQTHNTLPTFTTNVEASLAQIKRGGMVIMVDEADRENEGDLVLAAEFASAEHVNFMAKEARGLICLTLDQELIDKLKLPMMADSGKTAPHQGTAFTMSIEARTGVTTGISAQDRARTIQVAIADRACPDDIVIPGHIFPLRAKEGGVLERAGHTEGSVDLAKLAGFKGAGVICEIMNDDGTMARLPDLEVFSKKHNIPIIAISDMIKYRLHREQLVTEIGRGSVTTPYGDFESVLFRNQLTGQNSFALIKGDRFDDHVVEVRVHSQRPLADVFATSTSAGGFRLDYGLRLLHESERAVFLYLSAHESADRLMEEDFKVLLGSSQPHSSARSPQSQAKMDERMLGTGAQILRHLGVRRMRIHTTSKNRHFVGLSGYGLEIVATAVVNPDHDGLAD